MMIKRLFDVLASGLGLLVLAPVLLVIALAVKLDSAGPVLFRQERVGRLGRTFRIHKFRTMVTDAESRGLQITTGADARVTRVGGVLRKYKLDELPQLMDVFVGHMSLVGPRPEVPRYVACYPPQVRDVVLSVRPGMTDWASIRFRDENTILGQSADPLSAYINEVLPIKIGYYTEYVRSRTFWGDLRIIFATLWALASSGAGVSDPVQARASAVWRWTFWACLLAVLVLSLIPAPPKSLSTGWDKGNHLLAFAVSCVLGQVAYPGRRSVVLMGLVAYGALIEVLQSFTPQRQAEWVDWLADGLGILLGWGLMFFARWGTPPERAGRD